MWSGGIWGVPYWINTFRHFLNFKNCVFFLKIKLLWAQPWPGGRRTVIVSLMRWVGLGSSAKAALKGNVSAKIQLHRGLNWTFMITLPVNWQNISKKTTWESLEANSWDLFNDPEKSHQGLIYLILKLNKCYTYVEGCLYSFIAKESVWSECGTLVNGCPRWLCSISHKVTVCPRLLSRYFCAILFHFLQEVIIRSDLHTSARTHVFSFFLPPPFLWKKLI